VTGEISENSKNLRPTLLVQKQHLWRIYRFLKRERKVRTA